MVFLLYCGCKSSEGIKDFNFSHVYDFRDLALSVDFMAFHHSKDTTEIFFRVNSENLLYTRDDKTKPFTAKVAFSWQVLDNLENKTILDSASSLLIDEHDMSFNKPIIGSVKIKSMKEEFTLLISTTDVHRNSKVIDVLSVNSSTLKSRQNFLIYDLDREAPVFKPHFKPGTRVLIRNVADNPNRLYGRYYRREFSLPPPPFATVDREPFRYDADSLFTVYKNAEGFFEVQLPDSGFFHLQVDESTKSGVTLFVYGKNFPEIKKVEDLIAPLRFVTSMDEYTDMNESVNPKKAVDNFWLSCSGSKERARELIRNYYNRVQNANKNFTSFKEGWKTDRGIVNIIYGKPNYIYKYDHSETWVYGDEGSMVNINFNFVKVNNPFSDNDYILQRNQMYKSSWYRAVDTWRSGRVYNNR
jgi:GWxTD domain-containing protein